MHKMWWTHMESMSERYRDWLWLSSTGGREGSGCNLHPIQPKGKKSPWLAAMSAMCFL